jgi:hypothetical protein
MHKNYYYLKSNRDKEESAREAGARALDPSHLRFACTVHCGVALPRACIAVLHGIVSMRWDAHHAARPGGARAPHRVCWSVGIVSMGWDDAHPPRPTRLHGRSMILLTGYHVL